MVKTGLTVVPVSGFTESQSSVRKKRTETLSLLFLYLSDIPVLIEEIQLKGCCNNMCPSLYLNLSVCLFVFLLFIFFILKVTLNLC